MRQNARRRHQDATHRVSVHRCLSVTVTSRRSIASDRLPFNQYHDAAPSVVVPAEDDGEVVPRSAEIGGSRLR